MDRYWDQFRALPYADEILVAVGALLLLFAIVRIVRNSVTMLVWVLLAGLGLGAVAHGTNRAPWQDVAVGGTTLGAIVGPGERYSRDVLRVFCARLDEAEAIEGFEGFDRSRLW